MDSKLAIAGAVSGLVGGLVGAVAVTLATRGKSSTRSSSSSILIFYPLNLRIVATLATGSSSFPQQGGDRVSAVCTRETREAAECWFTGTLSTSRGRWGWLMKMHNMAIKVKSVELTSFCHRLASLKTLTPAMLFNRPRRPLQRFFF